MSVTAGNGGSTAVPRPRPRRRRPRPRTTLNMSDKLSNSLNKLEALVPSTTSRTTADGDDASVVKKFPPAWDDNDDNKAEKLGGAVARARVTVPQ